MHDDCDNPNGTIRSPRTCSASRYLEANRITGNYEPSKRLNFTDDRGQPGEYLLTGRVFADDATASLRLRREKKPK